MHPDSIPNTAPATLTLPVPRWPYLWPLLLVPAYALNPVFNLARSWNETAGHRAFGLLLLLAALVGGLLISGGLLASQYWRELRIEAGRLTIRPAIQLPRGLRWCLGSYLARIYKDGHLELPLNQAGLEWVGRTLLLHGHPEMDVRLGRGERAERVAKWLVAHGLPEPVGR
jgi:hypothetical protein